MFLYEFDTLTLKEKLNTVRDKGVFFAKCISEDISINCYQIDNFFVEVVYNAKWITITEVRSFKYGHSLDKYAPKF